MTSRRARLPQIRPERQWGLSLVELMVGITLGLMLMVGLGYLYVGGRQTFRVQDNLARIQENGRYAMEVIGRDLRMVGYMGCGSLALFSPAMTANPNTPAPVLTNLDSATAMSGTDGGTDTLTVYKAADNTYSLSAAMTISQDIPITATERQYAAGTFFIVADCTKADIFRASTTVSSGGTAIEHKASHNDSDNLNNAYGTDAVVMPFEAVTYSLATNPAGNLSLYRSGQEVVENVKDMQISYGVDTSGDGAPDQINGRFYVRAAEVPNWSQVVSVRVSLLLRSPDPGVAGQAQTNLFWDTNADGVSDLDVNNDPDVQARRLLYVYTSTIGLRNRLR